MLLVKNDGSTSGGGAGIITPSAHYNCLHKLQKYGLLEEGKQYAKKDVHKEAYLLTLFSYQK